MGTPLANLSPASTADTLLKTNLEGPLTTTMTQIGDGAGNDSPLFLATDKIGFNEAVDMTKTSTELNNTVDKVANITITQAVDLDTLETNVAASKVKTDLITITQGVDLDAIETNSNASKVKTDLITVTQPVDLDTIESTLATALQPANIVETITNGVTTNAPSENAVFDALALKADLTDLTDVFLTARSPVGSAVAANQLVYITGATGQTPRFALAQSNALSTSRIVAATNQSFLANTTIVNGLTQIGILTDCDTSGFAEGDPLWLSETVAGAFQNTAPSSPNFSVPVGFCLYSHAINGKIQFIGSNTPISENTTLQDVKGVSVSEAVVKSNIDAIKLKTDYITVTQAVDLDTIESDTVTNSAKVGFTNELAQDAVGAMINDSLVYDDATPALGINLAKANVFTADQSVPDDAYDATTWNGNMEVPTKNAIRDKIETMSGGASSAQVVAASLSSTQTNYAISGLNTSSGIPTILYVTPTTSFTFQSLNLTGVEDGKTIILVNSTVYNSASARAFIIENNNGASGTKFLYTYNGVPMIMTPGGVSTFIFTDGYLRLLNSTCFGDSPNACFDYFDDLLWTPVTSGSMLPAWKFGSAGTSSIATNSTFTIPTDINPQGVLGISTGSATAVGSFILQQQNLFQGGRGYATFLGRGTPATTLSTGTDTWFDFMGFMNGDGSSISNGVYWKYDAATETKWFPATNLNGAEQTVTGEGPTVNVDQMPYLGIFINGDWTRAEYFYSTDGITWTFCATAITSNIPTASDRLFSVGAHRRRTAGTATRILAIDLLAYTYRALRTT